MNCTLSFRAIQKIKDSLDDEAEVESWNLVLKLRLLLLSSIICSTYI